MAGPAEKTSTSSARYATPQQNELARFLKKQELPPANEGLKEKKVNPYSSQTSGTKSQQTLHSEPQTPNPRPPVPVQDFELPKEISRPEGDPLGPLLAQKERLRAEYQKLRRRNEQMQAELERKNRLDAMDVGRPG